MREMRDKIFSLFVLLLLCAAPALGQLTSQGNEQVISYSGATAFVLTNTPVNPNLLTSTGTNTFIMNVNPPTNSVRIYITNDTANACSNLTVSVASTGNTALNSFNSSVAAWQTVQVQTGSGAFVGSQPITLPASGTVAVTSQAIIGSKIAVFIVLSSGCNAPLTSIDVQVVFGTFSPSLSQVQGLVANGATGTSINPVLVGGTDASGFARTVTVQNSGSTNGLTIGNISGGANSTYAGAAVSPASPAQGPLMTLGFIERGGATGGQAVINAPAAAFYPQACSTNAEGCAGAYASDSGYMFINNFTITTAGSSTRTLGNVDANQGAEVQTCRVEITATNTAGTTPTLDAYFQDSIDGTVFSDRIHFPQFTIGTARYWATLSGHLPPATNSGATSTPLPIVTPTTNTLAVNTLIQGAMGEKFQFSFVTGGTTPAYNGNIMINCK